MRRLLVTLAALTALLTACGPDAAPAGPTPSNTAPVPVFRPTLRPTPVSSPSIEGDSVPMPPLPTALPTRH